MSKTETPDSSKQNPNTNPAQPADSKPKEKKSKKPRVELPPLVEMVITFAKTTVVLVAVMVALISLNMGADLQTIFIRTMVTLVASGLLLWIITWWLAQLYFEGMVNNQKNQMEGSPDGTMKDIKA